MDTNAVRERALELLRSLAGPSAEFRDGQWEAIEEIVVNRGRALVVQRTGWGKSAVYFIATRLMREAGRGPTLIVSPLLALMNNQIDMAERMHVVAETINSTNRDAWDEIGGRAAAGEVDLLLVSPERLNNRQFLETTFPSFLRTMGLLVVDEVHCISDWGHDFRPDYRRIGRVVQSLPAGVPALGTTATANDRVVEDVAAQLGANLTIHRGSLDRDSLGLQVVSMPNQADRLAWLSQVIPTLSGSGIVYCLTIKDAYRVGDWLQRQGIAAEVYTGATDIDRRLEIESRLSRGEVKTVVATSALGMGYDNPHIEFVIHYQSPGSPIAYYQQVGRAGRAVDQSLGVLLSGWEDREIQDYFIDTAFPAEAATNAVLAALAESDHSIAELERQVNLPRGRLTGMLKVLEVEGAVVRDRSRWSRSAADWSYPAARIAAITEQRRAEQQAMATYTETDDCLMEFLRRELDDPHARPCGRCANCLGKPLVPIEVDAELQQAALQFLNRSFLVIEPRKRWPAGAGLPSLKDAGSEDGRCLSLWGDPGWARRVRRGIDDGQFGDELVTAMADMVFEWDPTPTPTWVTAVPSSRGSLVDDFAQRLAEALQLPFVPAVTRRAQRAPQKAMQNSSQQFRNVQGAFAVDNVQPGPVLLIDDTVDTRWTLTMVGHLLREAGAAAVLPVTLTDTSRSGS